MMAANGSRRVATDRSCRHLARRVGRPYAGYLSDELGRKGVLLLAVLVFLVVYAGFGLTKNAIRIGSLSALYGVHQGAFRSVGKALAALIGGLALAAFVAPKAAAEAR